MDDRNWSGDTELTSGSLRRKRSTEIGGPITVVDKTTSASVDDDKLEMGSPFISNGPVIAEESHTRSLLKGVTWRCLATLTTVIIAWFVTGEVAQAVKIGFVEFFAKLAIYYIHERVWAKIRI